VTNNAKKRKSINSPHKSFFLSTVHCLPLATQPHVDLW
jgi:hypothetical protein